MAKTYDGILVGPGPVPDEPRNAYMLVAEGGVWKIVPALTLDRPDGGWFKSGFSYRLTGGRTADGADLFLKHEHAAEARDRRNARPGTWGKS